MVENFASYAKIQKQTTSQTLRHYLGGYCREFTFAHSQQPERPSGSSLWRLLCYALSKVLGLHLVSVSRMQNKENSSIDQQISQKNIFGIIIYCYIFQLNMLYLCRTTIILYNLYLWQRLTKHHAYIKRILILTCIKDKTTFLYCPQKEKQYREKEGEEVECQACLETFPGTQLSPEVYFS